MTYRFKRSSGIIIVSLLFLFSGNTVTLFAQSTFYGSFQDNTNQIVSKNTASNPVGGTLQILAIMVEFQPDENRFTSGNGTFGPGSIPYLENPGTNLDALPHNREYFEAHLEFAKNYFRKMSHGNLNIDYHVLPQIFRLPNEMKEYSPVGEDPELNPLAYLAKDAWSLVMQEGPFPLTINPDQNTAFVIFHAGVGRDIQLTGTTLDKTPQDIPSVYLNRNAFRKLLADPSFSGFEINNGDVIVDNTLILPRTLSRSGEDLTGNRFILPLSINGMVTAQIGSHLGLPDLFNTQTGESGIGRFGLMDGAGIFAYNGLFPPELSAWERIFLGWAEPFIVTANEDKPIWLPAISLDKEKSIAKIAISADEYFLIENRHRDPDEEGVILTIQRPDGSIVEQQFTNQDIEFVNQQPGFDQLLEPGVVIDVSNYDFALPGGLVGSGESMRLLNGGILIWRIDDAVIRQRIRSDGINDNPDRRGVDLMEADGARDIGRPISLGLFQNESNGSAFDFWWSGNNSTVVTQTGEIVLYENRFGPDTYPNNRSNSGALSFFELYNFSDNLPVASFEIEHVNPHAELLSLVHSATDIEIITYTEATDDYFSRYPLAIQPYRAKIGNWVMIPGTNGIHLFNTDSGELTNARLTEQPFQQPFISSNTGLFTIAEKPVSNRDDISVKGSKWLDDTVNQLWKISAKATNGFISSHEEHILDFDGTSLRYDIRNGDNVILPEPSWFSEHINGYQAIVTGNRLMLQHPDGLSQFPISDDLKKNRVHTGIINRGGNDISFYLLLDNRLAVYTAESGYEYETVLSENHFIEWPAITDFNKDGYPDFLYIDRDANLLIAKNIHGAVLPNFPIYPPREVRFIGTPIIGDLNGDGNHEILITGQDQYSLNIFAYGQSGKPVTGFPLYVGLASDSENQPVHPLLFNNYLVAVSHGDDIRVWQFPNLTETAWVSRYGNQTNNKITSRINATTPEIPVYTLLNKAETYNWPNPAVNETFLRFETREPAQIRIRITSLSGRLIYDTAFQSRGNLPEDVQIDTSSWASGGYLALVEAKTDSKTERTLIKIAIVK